MTLLDRIRNWRLRTRVPKGTRFRYAPNGIDKIFVNIDQEVKNYNLARKRQKEKEELDKKNI